MYDILLGIVLQQVEESTSTPAESEMEYMAAANTNHTGAALSRPVSEQFSSVVCRQVGHVTDTPASDRPVLKHEVCT